MFYIVKIMGDDTYFLYLISTKTNWTKRKWGRKRTISGFDTRGQAEYYMCMMHLHNCIVLRDEMRV